MNRTIQQLLPSLLKYTNSVPIILRTNIKTNTKIPPKTATFSNYYMPRDIIEKKLRQWLSNLPKDYQTSSCTITIQSLEHSWLDLLSHLYPHFTFKHQSYDLDHFIINVYMQTIEKQSSKPTSTLAL